MKVLVTGSSGYVGKNLVRRLKARGIEVTTCDIKAVPPKSISDITPISLSRMDAVVHLAAFSAIEQEWKHDRIIANNILAANNIIKMVEREHKPLIFFSSSGVHQETERGPYVISKEFGECIVRDRLEKYVIVRPSNIVGATWMGGHDSLDNGHILPRLFDATVMGKPFTLYGNGDQVRDYIHVGRVCSAVETLLDDFPKTPLLMELCSGEETSLSELLEIWKRNFGPIAIKYGSRRSDPKVLSSRRAIGEKLETTRDDLLQAIADYRFRYERQSKAVT